jgi:pSer/pThr/pTyr-binding forkhead associated (FHA) protein
MATLMCPVCRKSFSGGEAFCPIDLEFLVPVAADPVPDPSPAPSQVGPEQSIPVEAEIYRPPTDPQPASPNATVRDRPGGSSVEFVLEFPWGPVVISADDTLVGRSPDAGALAVPLAEYRNVGRHHARLQRDGDTLYVRDLDSVNHTFVNDRQLVAHEPHRLRDGDVVRFAAHLSARVRERRR